MQQRGSNTMDSEETDNSSSAHSSRNRNNSKLKVLVRSHAMREEASPPRDPSPNTQYPNNPQHLSHFQQSSPYPLQHPSHHQQPLQSPCITLIPSPEISSSPLVVLSPSMHSPNSLCKSPQCLSPTATLVPSPSSNSRNSPNLSASVETVSPIDRLQMDHHQDGTNSGFMTSSPKFANKTNSPNQASHNFKKKNVCDCQTQNCLKCMKNQERNINNNLTNPSNVIITGSPNMLSVSRASSRNKLRQQSSSLGSFDSSLNSPCLSRDSSSELYTDTTGVDLELFIPETLNRNAKDRALMLRIEQELVNLAKDKTKTHYKFPPMSSYQRMLVHRCAAYFGMDHNIEPTGKSVVVNKTKNTRIPDIEFKEHIKEDIIFSEEPRRSILKRDSNSIDDYSFKSPDRSYGSESRRSKSFEEREEEYEKARRRIFNRGMRDESSEDFGWSEMPWSSTESDFSSRYRLQTHEMHHRHTGTLIKGHSEDPGEALRPCVAKSYSFGGYGGNISVLSRGDSVMSTHSAGPRLLTKQDSGASSVSWRLSPSSSGYKSQSQMSESVTPSPTSTPHPCHADIKEDIQNTEENEEQVVDKNGDNQIIWAVTDIHNVPKGSLIINPQTGQPLKNEDGSLYHYDPNNVLPGIMHSPTKSQPLSSPHKSPQKELHQSPKKSHSNSLKSSPSRKSQITHSATSPSLPYTPPMVATSVPQMPQKSHSFSQSDQTQHQYASYHATFTSPPAADPGSIYQQPCVVYSAPYEMYMSPQYDNRLDVPANVAVSEMPSTYYLPECSGPPPQVTYQPAQPNSYWNQPITYYPNSNQATGATPPRYPSVPLQQPTQTGYLSTSYPPNFMAAPVHQMQSPPDLQPVYPNQPVQVVYQNHPATPAYYQNHPSVIYSQNPSYSSTPYPQMGAQFPQQPVVQGMTSYPQNTATPNSCSSSNTPAGYDSQTMFNLAQSIQQMNLGGAMSCQTFMNSKGQPLQYDFRQRQYNGNFKGKQIKCFLMGSSQSSTGTNSPAATVIAGYCPQNSGLYRTPPETPPAQFAFQPNFNAPMILKQVPNVRATTPGTAKTSRSPTPASDVTYFDRQKMSIAPNLYQGISYMVPAPDPRFVSGRSQPNVYRHQSTQMSRSPNQGTENRTNNKNRKSKTIRQQGGLPPSGK